MLITPDYNPCAAISDVELLILDAQTVDETKSIVVCPPSSIKNHTFTLKASALISAGTLQLETANDPAYTGVWAPLGGGPIDLTAFTAAGELQFQFSNITFTACRGRINDTVVGGNISLTYKGNH